jgi:threonine/homoserine/homoserine lactone efflux protein
MNLQDIGTFTLIVMLLTVMPGPNGVLLLKTVPQNGRRAGIINLTGIVSAFFIHGAFSILGLSALILSTSNAFYIVKLVGACYLLYLGVTSIWQALFAKQTSNVAQEKTKKKVKSQGRKLYLEGLLTNILNPKVSMFYLAAFPQFISLNGNPLLESMILVMIHSVVVIAWFSFIIVTINSAARTLSSVQFKRFVKGTTGSLMIWFGYRLLTFQQKS